MDLEAIIKLGAAITAARAQLRDAEATMHRRRIELRTLETQLANLVASGGPTTTEQADHDRRREAERMRLYGQEIARRRLEALSNPDAATSTSPHAMAAETNSLLSQYLETVKTNLDAATARSGEAAKPPMLVSQASRMPTSSLVRLFFERHPKGAFTVGEVLTAVRNVSTATPRPATAVRQAVHRLFQNGFLLKEGEGKYTFNPLQKELVEGSLDSDSEGEADDDDSEVQQPAE